MITINTQLLIEKRGTLSQRAVAKAIRISQSSYTMIEAGHRRPSVEVAMKLGRALGFDWWLLYIEVPDTNSTSDDTSE